MINPTIAIFLRYLCAFLELEPYALTPIPANANGIVKQAAQKFSLISSFLLYIYYYTFLKNVFVYQTYLNCSNQSFVDIPVVVN